MPRRYPIENLCCAVAYLKTLPDNRHRGAAMKVIEAQIGMDYAEKVRKAWKERK